MRECTLLTIIVVEVNVVTFLCGVFLLFFVGVVARSISRRQITKRIKKYEALILKNHAEILRLEQELKIHNERVATKKDEAVPFEDRRTCPGVARS